MVEGETPALWPGGCQRRGGGNSVERAGRETHGVGENIIFEGGRPKPLMMKSDREVLNLAHRNGSKCLAKKTHFVNNVISRDETIPGRLPELHA